ncbi:Rib/alpha-like domain-containing protein [Lactobacillus sp. LL6]|uniref:Rib/alpha-like domain-containing protein n=1 Tax=Lactobacillus sp. LL6 TaxID=2596827 RepID=UPI0011859E76|nr:Rib/alpha-like domain-containing protein [Lactobacillus sp. LL6]TSO26422.1 YSIRK-type signal peptide-containing protein [Lactobacillus sp. LL6]
MLSKNNYKERLRKMEPKKDRFSIRKFSIGAASVLIGSVFIGMSNGEIVEAQDSNSDNGNDANAADKTESKVTKIPDKVVVTTTLNPKDFNNSVSTQKNTEDSKTKDYNKDEVNSKAASQAAQVKAPVEKANDNAKDQTKTSIIKSSKQTKAEVNKQTSKAVTNQTLQSDTKANGSAVSVQKGNTNAVASESAKAVENSVQTSAPTQTINKDTKGAKLPTDITAKNTTVTTESLKDYQNYMDNLEKQLSTMNKEDQVAALNDAKKKFDLLNKADQLALSNQVLATNDNLNSDYTVDENGVANIATFGQFSKAIVDSKVKTMNLTADIDFTGLKEQTGPLGLRVTGEDADINGGLYTGGISGGWNHTGLGKYELATADNGLIGIGGNPYPDSARDLTIAGNDHSINMGNWFISLWDKSGNESKQGWNITLKDLTLKQNSSANGGHAPFYFYQTENNTLSRWDNSITYDNVTADITGPLANKGTSLASVSVAGKNQETIVFKGTNNISDNYAGSAVDVEHINIADGASLTLTAPNTALKATTDITIGNNTKLNIRATGQDLIAPTISIGNDNIINLVDLYNSSMQNFDNNGITASKGITIGNGNTINFNTGDAISGIEDFNTLNRTDVRGIFASSDMMDVAAKLVVGQNNKINMDMAKGHSSAITADDIDVGENTDINIHTMQDNNHANRMNIAQSWEDPTKWPQIINQMSLFAKNPDFFHRAPITVAFNSDGALHLAKGASLKVVRDNHDENIITPMISFGSGGDGRKGASPTDFLAGAARNYSLIVDGGASLDLQDASSSKGLGGFNWKYSSYLDNDYKNTIHHAAMISMFGTNSNDTVQFGTEKDSKYIAPKYINLQRTGTQFGTMLNLEGKALPGKWSIDITQWWKNIQNVALMYGRAPLAQWDKGNTTNTPSNAWNIEEVVSQNGGGNTSYNYVPANTSRLSPDGFVENEAIQGISFGNSNGIAILPVKDAKGKLELTQYNGNQNNKGEITGNKSNLVQLQNFLNNFNWWKARRISYGTDLADTKTASDHSIHINENDQYDPIVAPQTYTEGKKLTIGDFSNNKIVIGVMDANYKQIKDNLNKIVTRANWGIDWSHTSLKDCLDSNGNIDQTKIDALKSTSGKSDDQIYQDTVLYNAYEDFIKNINNPDGTTGYDPTKFNSGLKLSDSTKESQTYNIPITVTYADGNADVALVPVTVLKKKQNTEYQPKYQTTTVKQGDTATVAAPTFMSQVPNLDGGYDYKSSSTAPKDITFSLTKNVSAPDFITLNSDGSITLKPTTTDNIGIYTIPVTVTYSDKSADNISAIVNITDGKSQVIWGNTNPDGTITGAVVVKPSDVFEAHKTTDNSMSFDSNDAKKAVGEVDVYTQDSKDASKLSAPVQYTYDANTGDFVNGTTKLGANISYETLPDTTQASTNGRVTVKFGMGSEAVKDGAIDNGKSTTITQEVKLIDATVANPLTPITIPKNDYATGELAKFLPSDKVASLINHQALDSYGKDHANNAVASYEVVEPDEINTYQTGIRDITVRINFKDGTYLDLPVKAGVKISDGEDANYQPAYDSVVSADQKDIISALPTWDKSAKPTDGVTYKVINGDATVNNAGIITIPASSLTDTTTKDITVQVTYNDGTKDYVHFLAYEVKGVGNLTDPYSARDAIHDANELPLEDTKYEWHTAPNPHISTPQKLSVDVTINGKTVNVPVTVTLTKTLPDSTTKVYSDDTSASIIVATPDYHKTTGSNIPAAPKVSEIDLFDETGKQVKKYTLSTDGTQYIDGTGNTISADAFSTKWADDHTLNTDSSKFSQDGTATTSSTSDDEKDTTKNSKYRVILHWNSNAASVIGIPAPSADNDTNWANVYANVYGAKAAEANKDNNNLEATHNVDSTLKDAISYVDSSDLTKEHNAEVDKITWKTRPDIAKLGKQTGMAEISFKDGTVLDIPVSITVNKSQADNFNDKNTDKNSLTHELSYGKGATIPATDALKGIGTKDETPESLGITGATFNQTVLTDQEHVGKDTDYDARVSFNDGSTAIVKIPVMVTDQATTSAPVAKDKPVQVDQGSSIDPSLIIDATKSTLPDNTTEKWTLGPDTSKPGTQNVSISLTYPDGTIGSLDGQVTVEATPITQTIQLKQGIPATDTDAATGITNLDTKGTDGMPKSVVWTNIPATDKVGIQDATVDITYNDGYQKKNVAVKINVWSTKKGTDEKGKDPTNPDYKNMVKNITRTIIVDGKTPIIQTVTFTRDKYIDTTNKDNVSYGVWSSEDPIFKETEKLSKDGYSTSVTGKDESDKNYKLTDKGTIAAETIKAPKAANTDWNPANETVTVTNKANKETVNISYIDKKSGKEIAVTPTQNFTGNSDDKVSIIKADDFKSFKIGDKNFIIPEGYKIDKNGLVASYTIPAQNGKLLVTLDKLTTINPSDVDPNTPGKKNSDMFETITRTITYTDPTTNKEVSDKQEVKYQRTKTTNEDDPSDISYGKWELMNGQTASWPDYEVKIFDGFYKISASGKDSKGNDITIVNKDGKKIITSDTPTVSDDLTKLNNVNIILTYTRTDAGKFVDDNKNNAATQTILVHQTKTNDPSAIIATDGIKKSADYKLADENPVVWKDSTQLPDTSVITQVGNVPTYAATVTFSDGSTADVNIPIKIWNDASKFNEDNNPDKDHKNVLGHEIDYNKGTVVNKGDSAIQGFDKDKYDITSVVYNENVDTSKVTDTTTPYDVDIAFADGSELKTGITVPVKIVAKGDASKFDHDNNDKNALVHELSYGKGYNNGALASETAKDGIGKSAADNAKTILDYNIDKVIFNEIVSTKTAHNAESQAATITFKDGTTSVIDIPVEITDEASENDKNIVIKTTPVQIDQGKSIEASNLVDADKTKVPEGTKYAFGKSADFNTPGTQNVTIIATYPDGTVGKEIAGKITVEATPEVQTITLKQDVAAKATDANAGIKNLQASGVDGMPKSVVWTSDAPSTDKAGKESINVTITYNDGYKKSVNIPVNVLETIHGSKDTPKDPNGSKDLYREVTRNVSIDGEKQPTQTVTFTRDVYLDTQNGNKIIGYSDWVKNGNFTEVNVHKDGYASIVKLNGKDVSLTNETIPAEDNITVDSPNENYVVTHSANADIVNIKYVNAKDKTTEVTDDTPGDSFNGTTGQKITMSKDQLTVPTGYKLNDTLNGDYTYTFGTDKNQTKIIYVDQLTTYHPDDEHIAPSGEDSDMFKDVTRKIIVKNPVTGKDDETDQVIHLARNKVINDTTGKVESYGKWTFKDDTKTWPEFDVPQFDSMYTITAVDDKGNKIDVSSKKIDSKSFDPNDEKSIPSNTIITISYARTDAGKFSDDNKNNAEVKTILVRQNTDPKTINAQTGIKENKDYTITSVAFVDPTSIDTKTIGTKNYDALVTFGDKSTVKVSIPVKVWNDKSKFDEDNSKNPLTQEDDIKQSTPTPAGSTAKGGFSDNIWKNYDIKNASFDKDVDTSNVTIDPTSYDVTVTFNDGTTTSVKVPVKIISGDATKFDHDNNDSTDPSKKNLLAQVIRVKEGTDAKTINAETGIKNLDQYDIKSVNFNDISKIDTSSQAAGKKTSYTATIVFNDGTQSLINIPIYVFNDAVNYHDDHKDSVDPTKTIATNPVHENMGSQVPATDAAKSLTADEISKYGITTDGVNGPKFNSDIDTSKVDKTGKNYAATLHFTDGSTLTDVQIKVLVDDKGEAAHFNDDNTDNALVKQLTWGKGTIHQASEAINGIEDSAAYNVTSATFTTLPSTDEVHPAQNFKAIVSFKDGTSLTVQIPVAITDQAHDTNVDTQPIHIPVDPGKTPKIPDPHEGIKDPDKLPKGTKVEWTNKTPVIPDPGKTSTTPEITITYPDGTKKKVSPKVDSIWAPVVGELTTKLNETPDLTNTTTDKEAITNFGQGVGYPETLTWTTAPDITKAGQVNSTIHVVYDDGYSVDITVPVNVLDVKKGSDVVKTPTDPDYKNMVKTITRTITVDGGTPIVQTITFTRDKYTDTTKTSDNISYGVWTTDDPTFKETKKVSKDGYTIAITGKDAQGNDYQVTDKGTIAAETIKAPKAANTNWNPVNEIITVTNKANEQKVTLNFVDVKDGKTVVGHQDLTGVTDQVIPIDPAKLTLPDSYKLDKNSGLPTSYKFKSNNNDSITILVDHLTTIKPSDVDPNNPSKNSDMFETITRKFQINGVTDDQVAQIPNQTVSFQRTKTINDDDPTDITYGEWVPVNATATSWKEVNITKLDHYNVEATKNGKNLNITSGKIDAVTVEPNGDNPTKDVNIVLTYTLNQSGQFKHDTDQKALVNTIRVKKGTAASEVKASDGISEQPQYHITSVNWSDDVQIDTSETGTVSYNAVVSFEDGSSLKVKIPVKVYDKASDFIDDWNNKKITSIPVIEHMGVPAPRTDAIKGFDDDTKTKYGIVAKDKQNTTEFTVDVPVDKVQETQVQAQVVFDDGSVATIDIPVDIKASQASDFKNNYDAKVQTVEEIYNSTVDKHDAFTKGLVDAKRDNVEDANFIQNIDTTQKDTTTNYRAKLEFNDGSTIEVMIPVKIVTEAEKFNDANRNNALIKGLEVKVGDVVNKDNAIDGLSEIDPENPIMDKAEFKNTVTTDQSGTNNYQATITFKDGSTIEVTIPVTVGDDEASRFNPVTDLQPIEVHKGDNITPSNQDADSALKNVPKGTHAQFDNPSTINTTVPGTTKHDITITFPDGSKKEHVSVDVHIYTDSDKFDYTKNVKPITIHHGTTINPTDSNNAKDAVGDPDSVVESVKFIDPSGIDTSTVGEVEHPQIIITFKDGSSHQVKVPVTIVNSDADNFNSSNLKQITVNEGDNLPSDPKVQVIDSNAKNVIVVTYDKSNDPDVTKTPGEKQIQVNVTFKDGSTKTLPITVVVGDKGTPTKYEPGQNMTNDEFNKYVTRTIEEINPLNNKVDYIIQTIHFVREDKDGNAAYTDPVSGKKTYVPWIVMDKDGELTNKTNGVWKEVSEKDLDSFDGYKPSVTNFAEVAVTPDTNSKEEQVAYIIDFNAVSILFANQMVNTEQSATFTPILISKKTGKKLNLPLGQLLYSFDPQNMKDLPKDAQIDDKTGKITIPAGQLAKLYNMSLIAKNGLGESEPLVATLDVAKQNNTDNSNNTTHPTDNTSSNTSDNANSNSNPSLPDNNPITPSKPIVPSKNDSDKYAPIGQDITTKPGQLPNATEGIKNKDQMPAGTTYTWKTDPNVDADGTANGTIIVKFKDGSTKDVNVKIDVKNSEDTSNIGNQTVSENKLSHVKHVKPIIIHLTVKKGHLPDPEDLIKNMDNMPAGTEVYWIKKPNVHKAGKQEGIIGIKYPDGTTTKKHFFVSVKPGNALGSKERDSSSTKPSHNGKTDYNNSSRLGNNSSYSTNNYNSMTATKGEFADLGSLGRTSSATSINSGVKSEKTMSSHAALPKTGSDENEAAQAAGLLALGLGMIGLAGVKKHKKRD